MRRRALLASAGALLGGCLDNGSPPGEPVSSSATIEDSGEPVSCSGAVVTTDDPGPAPANLRYELTERRFPTKSDRELAFDAGIADPYVAPDDPGSILFGIRNESPERLTVLAGSVPPFGMLYAEATDRNSDVLLWRPYTTEGCYRRDGGEWEVCAVGREIQLESCDGVRKEYQVLSNAAEEVPAETILPGPGDYRITGELQYRIESGDEDGLETLPYAVTVTVEEGTTG